MKQPLMPAGIIRRTSNGIIVQADDAHGQQAAALTPRQLVARADGAAFDWVELPCSG
jgi:hypothetical protein